MCDEQDKKDELETQPKTKTDVVPLSISLSDSDDDEGKSVLLTALKHQLAKQRENLNSVAEAEFRNTGHLNTPRVREEMERFNNVASRLLEEGARYERQKNTEEAGGGDTDELSDAPDDAD